MISLIPGSFLITFKILSGCLIQLMRGSVALDIKLYVKSFMERIAK